MILFLSKYPTTQEEFRDGFFQRVLNIDKLFDDKKKVYITASPYRDFKKSFLVQGDNRIVIRCNVFLHFHLIIKYFIKANLVYIQSIHNILYLFLFIKIFKKKYVLDLHGLVPEEFRMFKDYPREKIFNALEQFIYSDLNYVIGVTNKLVNFYKNKYPKAKVEYIVYPILPNNLTDITETELSEKHQDSKINFIYSGNLQPWQNIDLMIQHISKINNFDNYFFQILTGQVEEMKKKITNAGIDMKNVDIRGVSSDQLEKYYKKAHYGFILRNDIAVNNVACPTKLIEYMNYGIIPIVLSEDIGDFKGMEYERLGIDKLSSSLKARKSQGNIQIIKKIYLESKKGKQIIQGLY
ncbi:hypothetical protein NAL32_13540 [Chryseobacterium sp. Ch-15]|uniref:Glycosyl transferase family 1 n=1 Tax=Chryseobacterium muglaense TaxID=2893752 RepID=A0A9Q3UYT7_9FLAO|nr:glycosyltransferase [Chryseobacterium muglaense]MBD3905444.1 glycosyl transferase family 1 [Chryseobacterium muglaense]MCC9036483.1 hypothetical protein [Chryseobacterium muglaense]MCM2555408.1 hypothetical protein [Chryseobacterium muglaense]